MIRFIGGMQNGIMTTDHDVRVQIIHDIREGYLPSVDGGEIREELSLREFLGRIFKDGREAEIELYRVSKCISGGYQYNNNEIERVAHRYNVMYAELFRNGKMVLAQHKMSHRMISGIDPYQDRRQQAMDNYQQRAMMQQMSASPYQGHGVLGLGGGTAIDKAIESEAKRANDEKKKRDDDLFFLTT